MLRSLHIENIAVIREVDIELDHGFIGKILQIAVFCPYPFHNILHFFHGGGGRNVFVIFNRFLYSWNRNFLTNITFVIRNKNKLSFPYL